MNHDQHPPLQRLLLCVALVAALLGVPAIGLFIAPPAAASDRASEAPAVDVIYLPSLYESEARAAPAEPEPAQF